MAVSKEALILPDLCVVAAANREALSAAVAELTETIANLPPATIKRRLRDAEIVLPFVSAAAANGSSPHEVQCSIPEEGLSDKI